VGTEVTAARRAAARAAKYLWLIMAAELVIGPVLALLLIGWGVFFASLLAYRQQQREERFAQLRARWEGAFCTASGQRLLIRWHESEGWIIALRAAPPRDEAAYFGAQLRGDTLTATLNASGVALDFRFVEDGVLVSPLVPGLFGDVSVEQDWLAGLASGAAARWQRE